MTLGYGIFDCDTHCYETRDAFTRYLPKEYLDRAIAPVKNAAGQEVLIAGRRVATFNSEPGLGYDLDYPADFDELPPALKDQLIQSETDFMKSTQKQPSPIINSLTLLLLVILLTLGLSSDSGISIRQRAHTFAK